MVLSIVAMPNSLILLILTATIIAVCSLVAAAAGAFLWGSATAAAGHGASTGLMAAVYAPFALIALLLPALAVPMARVSLALAGADRIATALPPAPWIAWPLIFGIAEMLTALARTAAGESALQEPPFVHAMLALYAAAAAYLLRRLSNHAPDTSIDAP